MIPLITHPQAIPRCIWLSSFSRTQSEPNVVLTQTDTLLKCAQKAASLFTNMDTHKYIKMPCGVFTADYVLCESKQLGVDEYHYIGSVLSVLN